MNMLKRILAVITAVLLAAPPIARAQAITTNETQALFYARDLAAGAYEYCSLLGQTKMALGDSRFVGSPLLIVTAGNVVTTTAKTASTAPFRGIDVGDEIKLALDGVPTYRYVATNADDDTITVDTAWDLGTTGRSFYWRELVCGTGANDGRIIVGAGAQQVVFDISIAAFNATSLNFIVEGRNPGAGTAWTPIDTKDYTATGGGAIVVNLLRFNEYRLGVKVTGDTGANTTTAKVTVVK